MLPAKDSQREISEEIRRRNCILAAEHCHRLGRGELDEIAVFRSGCERPSLGTRRNARGQGQS